MRSTESPKWDALRVLLQNYHTMTEHDMMKYALLNEEQMSDAEAATVLKTIVAKHMNVNPPDVETEYN